jgi:hypothetical protein
MTQVEVLENVSLLDRSNSKSFYCVESMGFCEITSWLAAYDVVYFLDDRNWNFNLHHHVHSSVGSWPF